MAEAAHPQLSPLLLAVNAGLKNSKTTAIGGAAGAAYYLDATGLSVPQSKQDWLNLFVSVLIFLFGLMAKDATTGSQPVAQPPQPAPVPPAA